MSAVDMRELRRKLYTAVRGEAVTIGKEEAGALLHVMGHRVSAELYVCDECGALVRTPAALARDGLRAFDDKALDDHLADCTWSSSFRSAKGSP